MLKIASKSIFNSEGCTGTKYISNMLILLGANEKIATNHIVLTQIEPAFLENIPVTFAKKYAYNISSMENEILFIVGEKIESKEQIDSYYQKHKKDILNLLVSYENDNKEDNKGGKQTICIYLQLLVKSLEKILRMHIRDAMAI